LDSIYVGMYMKNTSIWHDDNDGHNGGDYDYVGDTLRLIPFETGIKFLVQSAKLRI
jgi:hypothetical protein